MANGMQKVEKMFPFYCLHHTFVGWTCLKRQLISLIIIFWGGEWFVVLLVLEWQQSKLNLSVALRVFYSPVMSDSMQTTNFSSKEESALKDAFLKHPSSCEANWMGKGGHFTRWSLQVGKCKIYIRTKWPIRRARNYFQFLCSMKQCN